MGDSEFNYRAFLVFALADAAWADEFQRALESARIARQLVGKETPYGSAPADLKPIFRFGDAPEGQGGLTDEAASALADSLFLVVLCSPDAAGSESVDEAVRRFKLAGKRERIIPVIIDGEPGNEARECFPVALRFRLSPDGPLSIEPEATVAPLVIDARPEAGGKDRAVLTLTAALAGLDIDTFLTAELVHAVEQVQAVQQAQAVEPEPEPVHAVEPGAVEPIHALESVPAVEPVVVEPEPVHAVEPVHEAEPVQTAEPVAVEPIPLAAQVQPAEPVHAHQAPEPVVEPVQSGEPAHAAEPVHIPPPFPIAEPVRIPPASPIAEPAHAAEPAHVAEPVRPPDLLRPAEPGRPPEPPRAAKPPPPAKPARKPRSRMRTGLVAALLLIAVFAGGLAWLRYELPRNPALLDAVLETGTTMTTHMVESAERLGAPRSVSRGLAEVNESALRNIAEWAPNTPELRHRKAAMLLAFARQDEALGKGGGSRDAIAHASVLLAGIGPEDIGNPTLERNVAMAQLAAAGDFLAHGSVDEALKSLRPSLATLERRAAANPADTERQRDLSLAVNAMGDALLAKGALDEAFQRYREALTLRERLVVLDPRNDTWRRDLSVSHERIGDILLARAELNDALKAYRTSLALRLAAVDPDVAGGWQRQLAVAHNKIGDVLVARGALDEALNSYRAGLALQLAAAYRDDAGRRDLSVSYERMGDVLRTQRAWDEALAAYRTSLGIRERLAAADPGNARWERDLPVSHERIGDVLMGRGAIDDALAAYRTSLSLRERLAEKDQRNVGLQRDIAVSHNKIGDALAAQGASEEALKSYRAGLAIRERLVAQDPANAQLQWDLLVLQWRLASSGDDPAKRFGMIVSTMRDLAAKRQLSVDQARWLSAAEQELARVRRH
ncbi:MAG TPA: tetratricopeptide repeat protein [Rhodoplanes sp.]|nr:tetratricopeptide repeat protein [Rhodoplanes sp.]